MSVVVALKVMLVALCGLMLGVLGLCAIVGGMVALAHCGQRAQGEERRQRKRLKGGLLVCAAGALLALVISHYEPGPLVLKLDHPGAPSLYGISLANTHLQKVVFSTIARIGGQATVAVPQAWFTPANTTYLTNVDNAVRAMKQAGIAFPYGVRLKALPNH